MPTARVGHEERGGLRTGLLSFRFPHHGLDIVGRGAKPLLGALFGEPIAGADLNPSRTGMAGSLDLGGLQFISGLSQAPGSIEPADWAVGVVERIQRRRDSLNGVLGGHDHSLFDNPPRQ
jgi:hypothetical protein